MFPTLLTIGPISIDSYYLIWGFSMVAAVIWTRRRCETTYGISYDDASDIMFWGIIGMTVGATIGGYLDNWSRYAEDPVRILRFWESGMSSGPAFLGGAGLGIIKATRMGRSVDDFADASAIPCAFMIAIGRWGCFFSGCCRGVATHLGCGVIFPGSFEAVYPSQLFESAAALVIGLILVVIERVRGRGGEPRGRAVLGPVFLILYGGYRLCFDFLRAGDRIAGLRVGQYFGAAAVIAGLVWLIRGRMRQREARA